jgi:hypothetical protein
VGRGAGIRPLLELEDHVDDMAAEGDPTEEEMEVAE